MSEASESGGNAGSSDLPATSMATLAHTVQSVRNDATFTREDCLAVEAPLEIRLGGKAFTVLMRTPGHDEDLVRGFLLTEGIVGKLADMVAMQRPPGLSGDERGNVIAVELARDLKLPPFERTFYSSSSCGICGKNSIAQLAVRAQPIGSRITATKNTLLTLPERMRPAQDLFEQTGGVHASGLFTPTGELVTVREDVGRHNALDKLVGWALSMGRLPLSQNVLVVSGRVSYDVLQKAVAAGIPIVAAVGAPSSLAVDLAEQFNVTLIGFVRAGGMNIYTNGWRVVDVADVAAPVK